MKKKLLFFAPNHFNIDKVILTQLQELNKYEITIINNDNYRYKNTLERSLNFLSKTFLNKKLKEQWKIRDQFLHIHENAPYDICLFFRPDLLPKSILEYAKKHITSRKAVYWDSFEKVPELLPTLQYFNDKISFEKEDIEKYQLRPITNFYIKNHSLGTPEYDAFFFGSKDHRYENIKKLMQYLQLKNINAKAIVVSNKKEKENEVKNIKITTQHTPFFEIYKYAENTKIVIDIAHPNQKGLSMRPFEALGLKKKLITNNKEIIQFDFFNKNNIFVIEDFNNINIPKDFFETPYQEIPEEIYSKYHISKWLENILK